MPFRRKHRNPLFGGSRSGDKENANAEGMQEPLLPSQPPGLFRCHSDNTQRFCSDINPNTLGTLKNVLTQQPHHHRTSVLSTKEKMSNLHQLNSTLVKEVSTLRASQHFLNKNMEDLSEQLQAKSCTANALEREKEKLAEEINQLGKCHLEEKGSLEAEKKDVEDRLECVSLVVDNLQNMNGVLAEEAALLREDADRYSTEKHNLLADLDKMLGEKSILEELVDTLRASEVAFRAEMQHALQEAEMEKRALSEEKEALLAENKELQCVVVKITSEKAALLSQTEDLGIKRVELEGELCSMVAKHGEAVAHLNSERKALKNAQKAFDAERRELLSNKSELESSLAGLSRDYSHATKQFEAERQGLKRAAEQLASHNAQLDNEKELLKQSSQKTIQGLQTQGKVQKEELSRLQAELLSTKSAAEERSKQAEATTGKVVKEKDDAISALRSQLEDANGQIASLEGDRAALKSQESQLRSNILALECKLASVRNSLEEEKAQTKATADAICKYKEQLEKESHAARTLEGKLAAEKDRQKCMELHIQTMKGDLLIAEDAAIQAKNKAMAVEKEAGSTIERKAREASQKIGALESKLVAMVERQSDLENHIRVKENLYKGAVQAEKVTKAKLNGVMEILEERGKSMEGYFEVLKASMAEVQNNAAQANHSIALLQAEFVTVMDVKASATAFGMSKSKKKRGRSRAKAYQAQQFCN